MNVSPETSYTKNKKMTDSSTEIAKIYYHSKFDEKTEKAKLCNNRFNRQYHRVLFSFHPRSPMPAREDARPPKRQLHPGGRASPRAAIKNPICSEQEKAKGPILIRSDHIPTHLPERMPPASRTPHPAPHISHPASRISHPVSRISPPASRFFAYLTVATPHSVPPSAPKAKKDQSAKPRHCGLKRGCRKES